MRPIALASVIAALAGCTREPLVGSWHHAVSLADGTSTTFDLELDSGHTGNLHYVSSVAASEASLAGCTTTATITGFRWSAATSGAASTLAFDLATATETYGRTGCADPSDDMPAATGPAMPSALLVLTGPYTLADGDDTLTITQSDTTASLVFTRQ